MSLNIKLTPEEKEQLAKDAALLHIYNENTMRLVVNIKDIPLQNQYKKLFKELWQATRRFTSLIQDGLKKQAQKAGVKESEFIEMFDCDCDEIHDQVLQYIKQDIEKKKKT